MDRLPPTVQYVLDLTAELSAVTRNLAGARLRLDACADTVAAVHREGRQATVSLAAKLAAAAADVGVYVAREAEILAELSGRSVTVAETVPVQVRYP